MQIISLTTTWPAQTPPTSLPETKLEQAFLEEMLKYAGPKPSAEAFGGGIGEEQFATFLTREYAAMLSESLDFGFTLDGKGQP